jgi:hypothetical protein
MDAIAEGHPGSIAKPRQGDYAKCVAAPGRIDEFNDRLKADAPAAPRPGRTSRKRRYKRRMNSSALSPPGFRAIIKHYLYACQVLFQKVESEVVVTEGLRGKRLFWISERFFMSKGQVNQQQDA